MREGEIMGLFSFLGRLFGSKVSSKEIAEIRREISFAEAIKAHTAWKSRLQTALEGRSDETLLPAYICQDNLCVLGKWIHGAGTRRFGGDAPFEGLRSKHAQFHVHAARVVELTQAGEQELATMIFENEYAKTSHEVIGMLVALKKEFGEDRS